MGKVASTVAWHLVDEHVVLEWTLVRWLVGTQCAGVRTLTCVSTQVHIEGAPLRCTVGAEGTVVRLLSCVQVYVFFQELLTCCAIRAVGTRKRSLACVFECVSPKLKRVGGGVSTVWTLMHLPNRGGSWPLTRGSSSVTPLWVCLSLHLKRRLILLVIVMCIERGYSCPTSNPPLWGHSLQIPTLRTYS